jgi:2-polyprenyl-3-methyl-5-hydroxy-6-metoxy-1,4-benzoquinol methylase
MKQLSIEDTSPAPWKSSYCYDLEEVFDQVSQRGYAYAYENRRKMTLRFITDVLQTSARILDAAAAQGNFSLSLPELGYDVTWNDLRADIAEYVQLKHEFGKIAFAPGNAFQLSSLFDAVITVVIEHVAHPDEFLTRTAAFLKPGGYVVMTTPNGAYLGNPLPKFSNARVHLFTGRFSLSPTRTDIFFSSTLMRSRLLGQALVYNSTNSPFCKSTDLRVAEDGILLKSLPRPMADHFRKDHPSAAATGCKQILGHIGPRFLKPRKLF